MKTPFSQRPKDEGRRGQGEEGNAARLGRLLLLELKRASPYLPCSSRRALRSSKRGIQTRPLRQPWRRGEGYGVIVIGSSV